MKIVSKIKGGFCHKVNQKLNRNTVVKDIEPPTKKNKYQIISICIAAGGLAVTIIINWDKICNFFLYIFL